MQTTFTILGAVTGELWWPMGAEAFKPITFRFAREGRPFVTEADTLTGAVEALMRAEDGDFSSEAKLTGDSVLVVERVSSRRTTKRWFPVTMLPSIAQYVAADVIPDVEMYG